MAQNKKPIISKMALKKSTASAPSTTALDKKTILSREQLIHSMLETPTFSTVMSKKINSLEKISEFISQVNQISFTSFFSVATEYAQKVLTELDHTYIMLSDEIYSQAAHLLTDNVQKKQELQLAKLKLQENEIKISNLETQKTYSDASEVDFTKKQTVSSKLTKTNETLFALIEKWQKTITSQSDQINELMAAQERLDISCYHYANKLTTEFYCIQTTQEDIVNIINYSTEFLIQCDELKEKYSVYGETLKETIDHSTFNFGNETSSKATSFAALNSLKNEIYVVKIPAKPVNMVKNIKQQNK